MTESLSRYIDLILSFIYEIIVSIFEIRKWRVEFPPELLNLPKIQAESVYADGAMIINQLSNECKTQRGIRKKTANIENIDLSFISGSLYKERSIIQDENTSYAERMWSINSLATVPTRRSIHSHGFSNLMVICIILESLFTYGLMYSIASIGFTGGLADTVNTRYLIYSTIAIPSCLIGLYVFLFKRKLNPELSIWKQIASIYFLLEGTKMITDFWNVCRFITNINENDQWYMLLTSRHHPKLADTLIVTEQTPLDCVSFIGHLKQGNCGKPNNILIMYIITLFLTGLISLFIIYKLVSHTIYVNRFRTKRDSKNENMTYNIIVEQIRNSDKGTNKREDKKDVVRTIPETDFSMFNSRRFAHQQEREERG